MEITRNPRHSERGPANRFTGSVRLDEIAAPAEPSRLRLYSVHFAPGSRTSWHRHPHGQVLHVTEGRGLVQCEGGPVEEIRAGDTVWIEADEKLPQPSAGRYPPHGAGARTFMTPLGLVEAAADGTTAEWDALVGDDAYPAA
ncbi:cupin domain-containing protein [Streptomyces sp. NA02950]|uniref:cupin domain-containing protein n=1 Tax=Streptomyces sp. NA02950 TaxID=2742137 RepID=UPI001591934F|nr:cupin domain-containing protein [Streptomyces sp. NA02950]QKV91414.1 cupin domain-containing protein [Streptomyces sp. NA02950]